ncbi:MAG: hypothetical protein BM555_06940 [Crocinitomix sp. MedPE-SWsnd]|nr:MAG: hypothetical protein BM555_06940 [Crocinitomix sp. MedPE-SWsnd]
MISCSTQESSENAENGKYFIKLGDSYSETISESSLTHTGDAFSDESVFKVGEASIHFFEFYNLAKASPHNVEAKSFGSIIDFEESVEGTATIMKVTNTGKNSLGQNFDIEGEFEGRNGEKGSFSLKMEHIE